MFSLFSNKLTLISHQLLDLLDVVTNVSEYHCNTMNSPVLKFVAEGK